jgi:hypothetical protein
MANNTKDTIYIDIDDEITAIIDKVKASNAKVIALVLPKRASMLQSIVNMKLLKRSADNERKNLVLVTSEAGLLPLAGAVRLHVAKTLSSAPEIPPPPQIVTDSDTIEEDMNLGLDAEEEDKPDLTEQVNPNSTTVGTLSEAAVKHNSKMVPPGVETLELPSEEDNTVTKKAKLQKPDKHLKVPNFNRFRLILVLAVVVIAAIATLLVLALTVWPHATIAIKTNASSVNAELNLTLDTSTKSLDLANQDIPATQVSEQKTFTQTVNTTGQKNEGNTATGQVTLSGTQCNINAYNGPYTIPAGTGISYNNLTYITQNDTQMTVDPIHPLSSNNCLNIVSNGPTDISAQSPGSGYNAQINNATVSNYPGINANGSASGGTDNIIQVVSQTDISTATSKIDSQQNSSGAEQNLINQLKGQGLYPVDVTFSKGTPQITTSPNVGDPANAVTVTETINYTMLGVSRADLNSVVDAAIHAQADKNQNIISTGINQQAFKLGNTNAVTDQVSLSVLAEVGPNISVNEIKKEITGKSPASAISAIKQNPDVTSVTIRLSPFWVNSVPDSASKITVKIAKPNGSA